MSKSSEFIAPRYGVIYVWVGIFLPTLLYPILVLLVPIDVLDRFPSVAGVCDSIRYSLLRFVPKIDFFVHVRGTSFPQVAKLATAYAAIWWLWMTAWLLVLSVINHKGQRETNINNGLRMTLTVIFAGPLFGLLCIYYFFAVPGDPSLASGFTSNSRFGYALMGALAIFFSSVSVATLPTNLFALFEIAFKGGKNA